jgi:hypothetical protein
MMCALRATHEGSMLPNECLMNQVLILNPSYFRFRRHMLWHSRSVQGLLRGVKYMQDKWKVSRLGKDSRRAWLLCRPNKVLANLIESLWSKVAHRGVQHWEDTASPRTQPHWDVIGKGHLGSFGSNAVVGPEVNEAGTRLLAICNLSIVLPWLPFVILSWTNIYLSFQRTMISLIE